jgi:uncharacterized protein
MKHAPELLRAHLREMLANFDAWRALYADDAVMEFPYGAYAGVATPLHGIDAISESVRGFLDAVRDFQTGTPKVFRLEGEDAVVAEFPATATVVGTGRHYSQDYVVFLRANGGKIVELREYFDAPRVVAAFRQ